MVGEGDSWLLQLNGAGNEVVDAAQAVKQGKFAVAMEMGECVVLAHR